MWSNDSTPRYLIFLYNTFYKIRLQKQNIVIHNTHIFCMQDILRICVSQVVALCKPEIFLCMQNMYLLVICIFIFQIRTLTIRGTIVHDYNLHPIVLRIFQYRLYTFFRHIRFIIMKYYKRKQNIFHCLFSQYSLVFTIYVLCISLCGHVLRHI